MSDHWWPPCLTGGGEGEGVASAASLDGPSWASLDNTSSRIELLLMSAWGVTLVGGLCRRVDVCLLACCGQEGKREARAVLRLSVGMVLCKPGR